MMEFTNLSVVHEDELGIFFNCENEQKKVIRKVRPQDLAYTRQTETLIIVYKKISSPDSIADEEVYFELPLTFKFPDDKPRDYKYCYFYRCRSGEIAMRNFESGMTDTNFLNGELCVRGKAKKLPPDSKIPKNQAIYEIDAQSGELRRRLDPNNVW